MNLLWYFDKCEWTGRLSPTLYFCYLVWIKSICITISIVSTLGNFATPQRRNWSANERLWDVFCSSPTDDETEQEGLCLWQNGQFGKIRFDPCPALKDPCPALQPITIQYPRITGLPPTALLIPLWIKKGDNVLIKNRSCLSCIWLPDLFRVDCGSGVLKRVLKWDRWWLHN